MDFSTAQASFRPQVLSNVCTLQSPLERLSWALYSVACGPAAALPGSLLDTQTLTETLNQALYLRRISRWVRLIVKFEKPCSGALSHFREELSGGPGSFPGHRIKAFIKVFTDGRFTDEASIPEKASGITLPNFSKWDSQSVHL